MRLNEKLNDYTQTSKIRSFICNKICLTLKNVSSIVSFDGHVLSLIFLYACIIVGSNSNKIATLLFISSNECFVFLQEPGNSKLGWDPTFASTTL